MVKASLTVMLALVSLMALTNHGQAQAQDCKPEQQDIIIILDSSTSIARADFKKQLAFVNSLIDKIQIGPDANQVGVISFSDNYRLNFHLNANRAQLNSEEKNALKRRVSSIRQIGGGTNTHKPLEYVRRYMFTPQRGDRLDKNNVCIVITDGQSYEAERTAQAAKLLRDDSVLMFALGVGPAVETAELLSIAGEPGRVFQATSYDQLDAISYDFSKSVLDTCEPVKTPPPPPKITGMPSGAVEVGSRVQLKCTTQTTSSNASLTWFKNNKVVQSVAKIEDESLVTNLDFVVGESDSEIEVICLLNHPLLPVRGLNDTVKFNVMVVPGTPQITYDPGQSVYDGSLLTLRCTSETEDIASTEVVWVKSRQRIPGDAALTRKSVSNTIIIPASIANRLDRYECHVIHPNLPEPLIAYAKYSVKPLPGPPTIIAQPSDPVQSGSRVTLTCISQGSDTNTRLVFYRDGTPIDMTYTRGGSAVRNDMVITATQSKDYECRVEHPFLDDDLVTVRPLTVFSPPNQPEIKSPATVLSPDNPVSLTCTATNADNLTELIWTLDGRPIDSTYQLSGSDITNQHTFSSLAQALESKCEARHKYVPAPLVERPPPISVVALPGPPEINNGVPVPITEIGKSVSLTCKSVGSDRNTVVAWYRKDREAPLDTSFYVENGFVVNQVYVEAEDSRYMYECRVTHPGLKEALNASVNIPTVAPSMPIIDGATNMTFSIGSTVRYLCKSRGSSRATQLIWYRNGEPVDTSFYISDGYVINEYSFVASVREPIQLACHLIYPPTGLQYVVNADYTMPELPGPPEILGKPEKEVSIGSLVELLCRSMGNSSYTKLIWYRDGRPVDVSYSLVGGFLVNEYEFKVSQVSQLTTLTCQLEIPNSNIRLNSSVAIQSQGEPSPPKITGIPTSQVTPGTVIQLQCKSLGASPATRIVWYQANRLVDSSYEISGEFVVNDYNYTAAVGDASRLECRLEFQPSHLRSSAFAVIPMTGMPGAPTIVGAPTSAIPSGSKVSLVCRSLGTSPYVSLSWFVNGDMVDDTSDIAEDYVYNNYELTVTSNSPIDVECRLKFPLVNLETSDYVSITVIDLPEPPVIDGIPRTPVDTGTPVRLVCRSKGTSPDTTLVWYQDGVAVDNSFSIVGDNVLNEYIVDTATAGKSRLECRMEYPPAGIRRSENADVIVNELQPPTVDQSPRPVLEGSPVTLTCRVKHNNNQLLSLGWYQNGVLVDSTASRTGEFLVNEYETLASKTNTDFECRLKSGPKVLTTPHKLNISTPDYQPPIISGEPAYPVSANTPLTLICTWPYVVTGASLKWVNPFTKETLPAVAGQTSGTASMSTMSVYKLVTGETDSIYECRVVGVESPEEIPLLDRAVVQVKEAPNEPDCITGGAKIDVVIILDSSSSITRTDFKKQLSFLSRFVSAFDIGRDAVQVGVVSFSNTELVNFYMNDYSTKNDLTAAISRIKQMGGGTNTHLPIQKARETMFTYRYGDRAGVPNIAIVLTDGDSYERDATSRQAQLLRATGAEVYAIGVGTGVDLSELALIAGTPEHVYYSQDYNSLQNIENKFVKTARGSSGPCPVTTTPKPPKPTNLTEWSDWAPCSKSCGKGYRTRSRTCTQGDTAPCPTELFQREECIEKFCQDCTTISDKADILFMLDTSSSVYEPDFEKMKLFLADFIKFFDIGPRDQKIASLTFSDDVRVNFYLNEHLTTQSVKDAFLRIPMHLGGTHTHKAIRFARTEIFSEVNGARKDNAKIAFVITDGRSYEPTMTTSEAELARRTGIIIYSIGIGPETDQAELERIAGDASRVYHVDSYDDIVILKNRIGIDLGKCYKPLGPVDGGYGPWGSYSQCSVSCGTGQMTRTRQCDSPPPSNGGASCSGPSVDTRSCNLPPCDAPLPAPLDIKITVESDDSSGGFTDWEFTSPCSVTCGEGVQEVARFCQYGVGCQLGDMQRKMVRCQTMRCDEPASKPKGCGHPDGVNVMFVSHGINNNGPNSYHTKNMMRNITSMIKVDGNRVRTSLTMADCSCGKNTGYSLPRYQTETDVRNHIDNIDLGDTASVLKKLRKGHYLPNVSGNTFYAKDNRKNVVLYFFDTTDVVTAETIEEANKLRMAGASVYVIVLDNSLDLQAIRPIASSPANKYFLVVDKNKSNFSIIENALQSEIC